MNISSIRIVLLALWAAIAMLEVLSSGVGMWNRPIIAGFGAGVILGKPELGILLGSMLEMTALGVHSYGGAAVPDYTTGAVIGVMIGYMTDSVDIGLTTGVAIAAITQNLDVLARTTNAYFVHQADKFADAGDLSGIKRMHYMSSITWIISRALPVLLVGFVGRVFALSIVEFLNRNAFIMSGFKAIGATMPAVGFVILLNYLPFSKQWYWVILGFVFNAYIGVPILGVALLGLVVAITYTTLYYKGNSKTEEVIIGGDFNE